MKNTTWGASTASTYSSLETAKEHTLAAPGSSVEPLANYRYKCATFTGSTNVQWKHSKASVIDTLAN